MEKSTHSKDLYNFCYQQYWDELRKINNNTIPLRLFSFRVYLAHLNLWKIINRKKLTLEEINVMNKIGCCRLSRSQLGIPRYRSKAVQV
jgi:hypothetical protein